MYYVDHFKCTVSLVISRAFTLLCNHYQNPPLELFSFSQAATVYPWKSNSQIPSHLTLTTTLLLSISTNLTLLLHVSGIIQCLSFCEWLISHNLISSRFIYVIVCVWIFFLFMFFPTLKINILNALHTQTHLNLIATLDLSYFILEVQV